MSPTKPKITGADLRVIDLNEVMLLIEDHIANYGKSPQLRRALSLSARVKGSLIRNLDHDRTRNLI